MPHEIKDALLIYNPTSGSRRHRRFEEIEHGVRILKDAGITSGARSHDRAGDRHEDRAAGRRAASRHGDRLRRRRHDQRNRQRPGSQPGAYGAPSGGNREHSCERTGNSLGHSARGAADPGWLDPANCARHRVSDKSEISGSTIASEGRYFLSVAGAGPDGAIVNGVSHDLKKNAGIFAYWAEGFRQLFSYGFPEMRIRSGGKDRTATIIVVGRTVHYGGPFKITTGANLFEDSFEFLTNSRRSRLGYLACLPAMWLGHAPQKGRDRDVEGDRNDL